MNEREIAGAADTALNLIDSEIRALKQAAGKVGGRATALMMQLDGMELARKVIGKIKSDPAVMRALKKGLPNS